MAEFGAAIDDIIAEAGGPETRIAVGKAELSPGFPHSIAGEARFSIIGRDPDEAVMRSIAAACRDRLDACAARHGLDVEIAEASWLSPVKLNTDVADGLLVDAATLRFTHRAMTSGAGHDAQTFARIVPSGLIFIPSTGGISHAPEEHSSPEAVEKGAALLAHAMQRWATRPR
jgi:N-carbamoyl-L-amino-acid hydrolase